MASLNFSLVVVVQTICTWHPYADDIVDEAFVEA